MLEITIRRRADTVVRACLKRGLVVKLDTFEKKRNARHWHLGFEKQPGVLEVTDLGDTTVLKVAANRDGGWAMSLARELTKKS